MRRISLCSWVLVGLAACSGSGSPKNQVLLRIERGNAAGAIDRIDLEVHQGISVFVVSVAKPKGAAEIVLPLTVAAGSDHETGTVLVRGTAFDASGAEIGRGSTQGELPPGEVLTLILEFGMDLGQDGGLADAATGDGGGGDASADASRDAAVQHSLTITQAAGGAIAAAGISCPTGTCTASLPAGTSVTLTATPSVGFGFATWTGDCAGTSGAVCTVVMTQDRTVSATFTANPIALTVTASGGTVQCAVGGGAPAACALNYPFNTVVTLTGSPAAFHVAGTWGGACSGTTATACTVTMSVARTVSASFAAGPVPLTVSAPGGSLTCTVAGVTAACASSYLLGTTVTINATPPASNHVSGWSADCAAAGTAATCTLAMTQARTTTVSFAVDLVRLTFVITGANAGGTLTDSLGFTCSSGTCFHDYPVGTALTIAPGTGDATSSFNGFGGCPFTDDGGNCIFTLTTPLTITGNFITYFFTVTVNSGALGHISSTDPLLNNCTSSCTVHYGYGHDVIMTAVPAAGHTFKIWSGGSCGAPAFAANPTCNFGTFGTFGNPETSQAQFQ